MITITLSQPSLDPHFLPKLCPTSPISSSATLPACNPLPHTLAHINAPRAWTALPPPSEHSRWWQNPGPILSEWRVVGCKNTKGVGVELIGGEMFVKKHTAKLKMRWRRQRQRQKQKQKRGRDGGNDFVGRIKKQSFENTYPFKKEMYYSTVFHHHVHPLSWGVNTYLQGQRQHLCW